MKFVTVFIVVMLTTICMSNIAMASSIEVDTQYDFKLALEYVFATNTDSIILITRKDRGKKELKVSTDCRSINTVIVPRE